jgi:hypothetical protein
MPIPLQLKVAFHTPKELKPRHLNSFQTGGRSVLFTRAACEHVKKHAGRAPFGRMPGV